MIRRAQSTSHGSSITCSPSSLSHLTPLQEHALAAGLPPVLDELLHRVLHCCCEDTWQARVAGAAALRLLLRTLPGAYISAWAPQALRAVLTVVRSLPEHCTVERASTHGLFLDLLRKVLTGEDRGADEKVGVFQRGCNLK